MLFNINYKIKISNTDIDLLDYFSIVFYQYSKVKDICIYKVYVRKCIVCKRNIYNFAE